MWLTNGAIHPLAVACLVGCLVYLGVAVDAVRAGAMESSTRIPRVVFLAMCLLLGLWSLSQAFLVCAAPKADHWPWYALSLLGSSFYPALLVHFHLAMTVGRTTPWRGALWLLLYLPGCVFLAWGMRGVLLTPWRVAGDVYRISLMLLALALAARWRARAPGKRVRLQATTILLSAGATLAIDVVLEITVPGVGLPVPLTIAPIAALIWVLGIWLAAARYRLMSPNVICHEDLIACIDRIVFILDPDLRIVSWNGAALATLGLRAEAIRNAPIAGILADRAGAVEWLGTLRGCGESRLSRILDFMRGADIVATDAYAAAIQDRYRDVVGFLLIATERRGHKDLQGSFKLTDRELEIVDLCAQAIPNRLIAERLRIAERTVETHLNNIYNKIGVHNKIELLNVAWPTSFGPPPATQRVVGERQRRHNQAEQGQRPRNFSDGGPR